MKNPMAFLRGVAKTALPVINTAIEIKKNKKAESLNKTEMPHNWWSIAGQLVVSGLFVVAIFRGIDLQKLMPVVDVLKSVFGF